MKALIAAIIVRILIVPSLPNLSDDIYRFIWDGRLWHEGIHSFLHLPSDLVGTTPLLHQELYAQLNSPNYFTIYPPIAQIIFWIATFIPSTDFHLEAILMKAIHATFDIGTIYIIIKLLRHFKLEKKRILFYALNPLIIIELTSNLHHEGIVIFFLSLMLLMMIEHHYTWAGIAMAAAIATKILPLLFCPLIFFYLSGRNRWTFTVSTIITTLLLFSPILLQPEIISNFLNSADLYLRKFEYNAGVYYVLRTIGYKIYGFNMIHVLGPLLMSLSGIGILVVAIRKGARIADIRRLILFMMLTYACYIFLSITVHPWYVAILIPLSLFTPYRTPILWSGLIMLTYINYSFEIYHEVLWVVAMEYIAVFAFLIWEYRQYGFDPTLVGIPSASWSGIGDR